MHLKELVEFIEEVIGKEIEEVSMSTRKTSI